MPLTEKQQLMNMSQSLKTLRQPFEAHLREIGDNFMPRRTRFSQGKSHKSESYINKRIINSRPRLALRTMQSGMQSGMTSPARPWFRLVTTNPELREDQIMKEHLFEVQRVMRQAMQSSGLYNVLHTLWGDLGWAGTDAMILENDMTNLLNPVALVPGEYWIAANSKGLVDTLYREVEMTTKYVVGKFVFKGERYGDPDWSVVTSDIKRSWDEGDYGRKVQVSHVIMPRTNKEPGAVGAKAKPIRSTYWLRDVNHGAGTSYQQDVVLGDLGYDDNPIVASRWDVEGHNTYGSSPAMDALHDAKSLQVMERDKREAIRRMNRPPMNAPVEMRNSGYSLMPEAVNYMADPSKGLIPAYQVNPPIEQLMAEINETEFRIDEAMYANLFLMISKLDRREITAREIDERHEEKLIGLGPVLERQHREKLAPLIKRYYKAVTKGRRVAPLPPEYAGVDIEIDYISTLAQAQKAVATGGVERLYAFMGNVFAVDQTIIDNVDNDVALREYADMLGVPNNMIRSKSDVEGRRAQRQAMMQEQNQIDQLAEAAPAMQNVAQAAKVASEADATGRPLDILRNLGLR